MIMSQADAEAGFAAAGPPAAGFAGRSAWTQEPTANGDFSGADLVSVCIGASA